MNFYEIKVPAVGAHLFVEGFFRALEVVAEFNNGDEPRLALVDFTVWQAFADDVSDAPFATIARSF